MINNKIVTKEKPVSFTKLERKVAGKNPFYDDDHDDGEEDKR